MQGESSVGKTSGKIGVVGIFKLLNREKMHMRKKKERERGGAHFDKHIRKYILQYILARGICMYT